MNRRYGRRAALVQQFSQNGDEDLRALCETIKFRWLRTAGERAQHSSLCSVYMDGVLWRDIVWAPSKRGLILMLL